MVMKMVRSVGVYKEGNWYTVVYPSYDTKDKIRNISFPEAAMAVIKNYLAPLPCPHVQQQAVLKSLGDESGQTRGLLATTALEILGQDPNGVFERREICGFINQISEEGIIDRRVDDDGVARFYLADHREDLAGISGGIVIADDPAA
jgi:hypothetical protein